MALVLMVGCGDNGNLNDADVPSPTTTITWANDPSTALSGTVATGAALGGIVSVKDSGDPVATKVVTIATGGTYQVDVSGMTPPFLLRAEGSFQGRSAVIHSVAGESDIGGTINITPLTDLFLSNASGQLAASFFDGYAPESHAPLLTPVLLTPAREALEARFAALTAALGLDGAVDLLRTPFAADHTGLDALLDVLQLRLKIDAEGNPTTIYEIVNVVTGEVLEDDLTDPLDVGAFVEVGRLEEGALAVAAIFELFGNYEAVFEGAQPSSENGKLVILEALVADTYLDAGKDKATWIDGQVGESHRVDMVIEELAIESMDLASTPQTVEVLCKISQGDCLAMEWFTVAKVGGSWQFYGNQKAN